MQFTLYGVSARCFPTDILEGDRQFSHHLCKIYGNQVEAARAARQLCKLRDVGAVQIQILRARYKPATIEVAAVDAGTKNLPKLDLLIGQIRNARHGLDDAVASQ